MVSLTYKDQTRPLIEWSRLLGVNYHTLYFRHAEGWEPREVLFGRDGRRGRRIVIGDRSHTVAEWSEIVDTPIDTIYHRLRSGWTKSEAVLGKAQKQI